MKIKSIPHIWPIFAGCLFLLILCIEIYILITIPLFGKAIAIQGKLFFVLQLFIVIFAVLAGFYYFKILIIKDEQLLIIFPFRIKSYLYKFSDLINHYTYQNPGRFIDYKSFHFQTNDEKTYIITQYEFFNFKIIAKILESHTESKYISKYHNLKQALILLVIAMIISIILLTFNYLLFNGN